MLSHITPDVLGVIMSHIVAVLHFDPSSVLAVDAQSGNRITKDIRGIITPFLFLGVGIAAMTFLFKRQMTQFFQFAAIACLIGAFWYKGDVIIQGIGNFLGGLFGS